MARSMEIENVWKEGRAVEAEPVAVTSKDLGTMVSSRVRKERKTVSQFVWAVIVYQIILYSFLARTLVRHWGDMQIMLLCLAAGALYVLLTVAFIRRVKALFGPLKAPGAEVPDVFQKVAGEHTRLADFFRFKKRMDWIGVPVSCAIIVLVTFSLFVEGGVEGNPRASLGVFAVWIGMSLVAIHAVNKKRFISPLRNLEQVLEDLKNS
jgi:amino acid transporter